MKVILSEKSETKEHKPMNKHPSAHIMYVFTVYIVRQNRKERLIQKRWSHIESHLIAPLDEREVSLKVTIMSVGSNSVFVLLKHYLSCNMFLEF